MTGIVYVTGRLDYSTYLAIDYLPGTGELTIFCGAVLGSALGILPGGGAILASFASYTVEKRISKTPQEFGKLIEQHTRTWGRIIAPLNIQTG